MSRFKRVMRRKRNKKAKVLREIRMARDDASSINKNRDVWKISSVLREIPYLKLKSKNRYKKAESIYMSMLYNPRVLIRKHTRKVTEKK